MYDLSVIDKLIKTLVNSTCTTVWIKCNDTYFISTYETYFRIYLLYFTSSSSHSYGYFCVEEHPTVELGMSLQIGSQYSALNHLIARLQNCIPYIYLKQVTIRYTTNSHVVSLQSICSQCWRLFMFQ